MKIFTSILIFLFSCNFIHASIPSMPEELATMILELGTDRSLPAKQEEERKQAELQKIVALIPDYGSMPTLEECVEVFVHTNLPNESYKIVNAKTTDLHGNSPDEVFFIFDTNETMQFVIKAFPDPESLNSEFIREFSGNAFIQSRNFSAIATPSFIGIGKCLGNQVLHGLILATKIMGERVDQLVLKANSTDERVEKNREVFFAIGKALAELHQTNEDIKEPFSKERITLLEEDLNILDQPEIFEKLSEYLDIHLVKALGSKIISDVQGVSFPASYQFGAAHLKNIFYEAETGIVGLIDTGRIYNTVDYNGLPTGDGAFDLIRVQEYFTRISLGTLTYDEVQRISSAIYEGYATVRAIPDQRLLNFYMLRLHLRKMITHTDEPQLLQEYGEIINRFIQDHPIH